MSLSLFQATQILSGLASEMRLEVFRALVAQGGMSAGELAAQVKVGPSTLSFHLKDLRHAGLVTSRKQGRQVIYSANFDNLNQLLGFLVDDCCGGRPELCIRKVEPETKCCDQSA
ncbi:metalloregulator ArsR/SmtB family transcription factor [Magnetovibrio sp. PR-2]|uniref:ArsR/SmtB family transcription factor n=1 Tax=Magnetovibrio sp. PR-2 TaxID=3120356 RepID=UPI002FCE335E